ncbi:hypothetical protein ACHAW6_008657 [Cyclotella cf. meneghiniana]
MMAAVTSDGRSTAGRSVLIRLVVGFTFLLLHFPRDNKIPQPIPHRSPSVPANNKSSPNVHSQLTCAGITPASPSIPASRGQSAKYLVFYPRNGMGNVMMSYISSAMYACLTGRIVKVAPYHQRDKRVFNCSEYFDADADGSLCHDLEMDDELSSRYESANVTVMTPEAWKAAQCSNNKPYLQYFLCDDGQSDEEFIAISSCQYWGDLLFGNPYFQSELPPSSFRDVLRARIRPSAQVREKMVHDGPYHVCVHLRWGMEMTTSSLGEGWIEHLGTCVNNLLARHTDESGSKKEVLLFTMHQDVRKAIKQSFENNSSEQRTLRFASETTPRGFGGHSNDRYQGIADMFSMGKQCIHLLPSMKTSTYFLMASNLMDRVSVFPGDLWKDGCREESQMTKMNPVGDYWNWDGWNDVCKLHDTKCPVKHPRE